MKNQAYRMAMLYDFYGDLLTDRQKEIYDLYYNEDLSLAEIAENYGITRQGVRDAIKHGEATLRQMEDKIGNARRHQAILADLERLEQLIHDIRCRNTGLYSPVPGITRSTDEMLAIVQRLISQEEPPNGI